MKNKNILFLFLIGAAILLTLYKWSQSSIETQKPIVIGSKAFTESIILGEIISILLEKKWSQKVERRLNLGGTHVVFEALKQKDIDIYAEYTGTGLVSILKQKSIKDPKKVYSYVESEFLQRWDMVWSQPIGFNNTYAIAVLADNVQFSNIRNISELVQMAPKLKYAAPHEFMQRKDGHVPFSKFYNLDFKQLNILAMQAGLMYSALVNREVDIGVVYSTDGRIKSNNLKLLQDDKFFFPPYHVAYITRKNILQKYPAVQHIFSSVKDLISEKDMIEMNDKVDRLRYSSKDVATHFLVQNKWIPAGKTTSSSNNLSLLHYFIEHKAYLLKLTKEHLFLVCISLLISILIAVPVGVWAAHHPLVSKVIFPFVNIVQTIPSLALLGFLIPILGIGKIPALFTLFLYSLLPIIRNTYLGIHNIDQRYMEIAQGIGLTPMQILRHIKLPLAFPSILTGIRVAAIIAVGLATLATLIGAGGLGDPIFRGIATLDNRLILFGAIPAALLGISVDQILELVEKIIFKNRYWRYTQQK